MKKIVTPFFLALLFLATIYVQTTVQTTSENDDENPRPTEYLSN